MQAGCALALGRCSFVRLSDIATWLLFYMQYAYSVLTHVHMLYIHAAQSTFKACWAAAACGPPVL